MPAVSSTVSSDRDYVKTLIETLVRECPRRAPASDDERRAQEMMEVEMKAAGLTVDRHAFTFGTNLYANIALHFGLGSFGTLISGVFPLGGLLFTWVGGGQLIGPNRRAELTCCAVCWASNLRRISWGFCPPRVANPSCASSFWVTPTPPIPAFCSVNAW